MLRPVADVGLEPVIERVNRWCEMEAVQPAVDGEQGAEVRPYQNAAKDKPRGILVLAQNLSVVAESLHSVIRSTSTHAMSFATAPGTR